MEEDTDADHNKDDANVTLTVSVPPTVAIPIDPHTFTNIQVDTTPTEPLTFTNIQVGTAPTSTSCRRSTSASKQVPVLVSLGEKLKILLTMNEDQS